MLRPVDRIHLFGLLVVLAPALAFNLPARGFDDYGAGSVTALRGEFHRRLEVISDDSASCITLGRWAASNGLHDEAESLFRDYLSAQPLDAEIHRELVELCRTRPLPEASEALESAMRILPDHFARHSSRHFIVLSDAEVSWTRQRLAHLERAWHQFDRFTRRLDLKPHPLRHKLVCVLFERREDYLAFAREQDGISDPSIAGYYSPRHDRIVFYNPADNPSVSRARDDLSSLQTQLSALRGEAEQADRSGEPSRAAAIRNTLKFEEQRAAQETRRVAQFVDQTSVATTTHEAVHQLLFHTRLQSPSVQYPLWINEGLATTFETEQPNQAFGPDHEYALRRDTFDSLLRDDRLIPLEALIVLTMIPSRGDETAKIVYHQSYALVTWLVRFRRAEFSRYLDLMRSRSPGRLSPDEHRAIFEQAFGEIERLERAWLRWERSRIDGDGRAAR